MQRRFAFHPRIIRSPTSDFYGREIEGFARAYPDAYLKTIAEEGYDGIWLHVLLRDVAPSALFPDSPVKRRRIECLNRLVEKAGRFGIRVYLYLCEPRGLRDNDPFWKRHAGLKGQAFGFSGMSPYFNGNFFALCSSTPEVRAFLEESCYSLFCRVPGLGGAFLITAGEFHTHCYSHSFAPRLRPGEKIASQYRKEFTCPRCRERGAIGVVADVVEAINRGIRRASPGAELMVWSWGWFLHEHAPQAALIRRLPKHVLFISEWERGGHTIIGGKRYPVNEYSFAYIGPSPYFRQQMALARRRGLRTMAKIQIGNTHEIASIPYLPVPHLLAEKLRRMKRLGVDGYLGCWIFGGDLTPMSRLAGLMSQDPQPSPAQAIRQVARVEFGARSAAAVARAWQAFSKAWLAYPFSIPVLYWGPINYAAACPFLLNPTSARAINNWLPMPRDSRGRLLVDGNLNWIHPYTPAILSAAFRRLLVTWNRGIGILDRALETDAANPALHWERDLGRHIAISAASTARHALFYDAVKRWKSAQYRTSRILFQARLIRLMEEELKEVVEDRALVITNPQLGYHSEAHVHLFTVKDLDAKIASLRRTLRQLKRDRPSA